MLPGLGLEFKDAGFIAAAAKIGNERIVETGDDEFGLNEFGWGCGKGRGETCLGESDIQLGREGENDREALRRLADFLVSSVSEIFFKCNKTKNL